MIIVLQKMLTDTLNVYMYFKQHYKIKGGYDMINNRIYYCTGGGGELGNEKSPKKDLKNNKDKKEIKSTK